jgi:hypothetical protein
MHNLRCLTVALAAAGSIVTGCATSSSTVTMSNDGGGSDGQTDGHAEADGHGETGVDSGGDCAFADFVIGLINKDTTATATPSTNLGASLEDSQEQSCFASLF